ncbi:MAG: flagellar assembly protein FliW [Desulfitobacteriia bacterium]|jgi:flagellar assembly factor FliW
MEKEISRTIEFPKGIPGFEEEKIFILEKEEGNPLARLDSATNKDLGFIILQPQLFFPDYLPQVELSPEEVKLLEVKPEDELAVWSLATISLSDITKSTVNLRAPLILNFRTNKGIQMILNDENYPYRQKLFAEAEAALENPGEGAVG